MWIKVEDSLPPKYFGEESRNVIVITDELEMFEGNFSYKTHTWTAVGFYEQLHTVTHWHLFPELPNDNNIAKL